jgi:hypothetical protein
MGEPPPATALQESAAVFSGRVVSLVSIGADTRVTFLVYQVWKGGNSRFISLTTPSQESSCGVSFSKADEWLVYAYHSDASGSLKTISCSRTQPLATAREDLQVLGRGSVMSITELWVALGVGLISCGIVWRMRRLRTPVGYETRTPK